MTELFADITLGAVLFIGLTMIAGVVFVANMNDPRNALHPGGRNGRVQDELLVAGPVAPFFVMLLAGVGFPNLRDEIWWFPVLLAVAAGGVAISFLAPPVRRARARVEALKKQAFS